MLFLCLKEAGCSVRTASGFLHTVPWILHKPSERDTAPWPHTFRERAGQRRCTNRGRNFVRSKRRPPYMSSTASTYFCALTIRKHLLKMRFERSGGEQEPSRGHKFSILENSCPFGTASCWGVPAPNPAGWFHSWWLLYCLYAFSNPDLLYMINL